MKLRRAFTLIELLVVVAVIGLLIAILIPSLSAARKRARTAVCMTNERFLVQSYRQYYTDFAIVLSSTGHNTTGAWDYQLLGSPLSATDYYTNNGKSHTIDKPRWCPETDWTHRVAPGKQSVGTAILSWDCRVGPGGGSSGSYGMNNWMYNSVGFQARGASQPSSADFYHIKGATQEFAIPVFVDCAWHDFLPRTSDSPGANLSDPEGGTSADRTLADAAIDRHGRAVNVSFWDGHIETVRLGDLWKVKWSATWDRTNAYPIP